MNEQPDQFYSQILMFVFIGIGVYSYFFSKKPQRSNLDFFELGYIMDNNVPVYDIVHRPTRCQVINNTPKPKAEPKQLLTQLQQDSIDVLIKLGMRKREATKRMHDLFAKYQPKTIQEFIQVAFKHEHN